MNKKLYSIILILGVLCFVNKTNGQVTTLSENFDVACATSGGAGPAQWVVFNPPSCVYPGTDGKWQCDSLNGRKNLAGTPTPGMTCTGVWSSAFHLDTSILITPLLNLSGYTHAYMHFDTRADTFLPDSKMAVLVSRDTVPPFSLSKFFDTSVMMSPGFSASDTGQWVTHEVDLTYWVGSYVVPVYFAVRYTSTGTTGSLWHIDNVNITANRLNIGSVNKRNIPMTILGQSSGDNIRIEFGNTISDKIQLGIYDMLGRKVYDEGISSLESGNLHVVTGLGLKPGMYFVKAMGNNSFGSAKVVIQ